MWWKKKKQERKVQTVVRTRVGQWIGILQQRWTMYWQVKEARWSVRQKKWYCVVFCLVAGGGSLLIIADTLLTPAHSARTAVWEQQAMPRPLLIPTVETPSLTTSDSMAVTNFRHWMDSLSTTPDGRRQLDSCWRERPGLLDSFLQLEQLIYLK